jgi:hypothetical protein
VTIVVDFGLDVDAYVARFSELVFPLPATCPHCDAARQLHGHGNYSRQVCDQERCLQILIKRLLCPICKRTVSLLPSFCLNWRHYLADTIEQVLSLRFTVRGSWSQIQQHFAPSDLPCLSTIRDWVKAFGQASEVYLAPLVGQLARWQLGPGKLELALADMGVCSGRSEQLVAAVPHLLVWLQGQGWRVRGQEGWLSALWRWGSAGRLGRLV